MFGNPCVPANKLQDFDCAYKIKLRPSGYRLVYEVDKQEIVVFVIAVGKRANNDVYYKAKNRV
jgi:mRNA interferase RelE/StbE